jgi:transcriptional regulator with XRE-family HTH domain
MSTPTHREATPGGAMAFIKRIRESRDVQSKVIASALGISPSQYSQMEGNASYGYLPPPDKLAIICGILRITQAEVIREAGYLSDSPAKRLDDHGDEYAASQDRWAAEHPDEVQRIADRISDRFRQVVIEELSFGGIR